jgi:hypothetical protein
VVRSALELSQPEAYGEKVLSTVHGTFLPFPTITEIWVGSIGAQPALGKI